MSKLLDHINSRRKKAEQAINQQENNLNEEYHTLIAEFIERTKNSKYGWYDFYCEHFSANDILILYDIRRAKNRINKIEYFSNKLNSEGIECATIMRGFDTVLQVKI